MNVWIIEFSFFDTVDWDTRYLKIMAESEEQLKETFLEETKYIKVDSMFGPETTEETQEQLWNEIKDEQEKLTFPLVTETYSRFR